MTEFDAIWEDNNGDYQKIHWFWNEKRSDTPILPHCDLVVVITILGLVISSETLVHQIICGNIKKRN